MGACLYPCTSCERHVRAGEPACPFCGAAMPAENPAGACASPQPAASRAAVLFATAAVVAACGGSTSPTSSSSGEPVALYGPAPVQDAGSDAATDAGEPVALYGPAPVDAGDG